MNPPAQLSTACRAGVNKEVEYFFKMGLRPKPRPAGPPPAAPLQPVVGFGLVMVGLEMVGLGMRSEIAVFRTAERGPCNFPPFRIILRLENAAGAHTPPSLHADAVPRVLEPPGAGLLPKCDSIL